MIYEFNTLLALLKGRTSDLNVIIDAGLIVYVIYLKRELNKKTTKEDLTALKEYISKLFIQELNSMKEQNKISIKAINQRITDLQTILLTEIGSIKN